MTDTPTFPARFATYEEYRAYRNAVNARYAASDKGRAAAARKNAGPKAAARTMRYRATEKGQAALARATERHRARAAERQQEHRATEPEKFAARSALAYAAKMGMPKPSICEGCQEERRLHGHHHRGYAKHHWLDVRWLCSRCHSAAHRG